MPIAANLNLAVTPLESLSQDAADLAQRVGGLEKTPRIQAGKAPPVNECRDGTLYVDTAALRLYVHAAGAWRWVGLN